MQREKLASLQMLRGLAALLVVIFHLNPGGFTIGAFGVDIFFVLSGFVMVWTAECDQPGHFLTRRIIRVVPLYWAVTLAMCTASLVPGLFSTFTFNPQSLTQSLLFIPYANENGDFWPLIIPGWTLNYEMFFYVIFALSLWLKKPLQFTLSLLLGLVILGLFFPFPSTSPATFWTHNIILEFALGMLLARYRLYGGPLLAGLLIVLGFSALLVDGFSVVTPEWRFIYWGIPALAIVAGCLLLEQNRAWPAWLKPMEAVGDASYSLYLTHGIVIAFCFKLLGENTVSGIIAFAASIAIAFVSFHGFEKPAGRYLTAFLTLRRIA
jgi:exopolysaccharide production protein ExoZ